MSQRRYHDVLIRKVSGQYYLAVKDATTGNRIWEMIVPTLDMVKDLLDKNLSDEVIFNAAEKREVTEDL